MKKNIKMLYIILAMFCFAGINIEEIFNGRANIVIGITYIIRGIVFFIGIVLFFIIQLEQKKYNKVNNNLTIYLWMSLLYIIIIFCSFANGNLNIKNIIKYTFALGLYFNIIYFLNDYKTLLRSLQIFYFIIMILNIVFYLLYPEIGVYTIGITGLPLLQGILTNRNSVLIYTIPLIIINNIIEKKNQRNIVNTIAILTVLATGSTTAIVVVILYILLIIISKYKIINIKSYILAIFGVFIGLLTINGENIIGYIVQDILKSDLTLSGRTNIWAKSLVLIPNNILLGHGVGSYAIAESMYYKTATNGMPINDTFNGILNIIFYNGVLGLSVFLIIISKVLIKLNKNQILDHNNRKFIILFLCLFTISISESIFQFHTFNFWIFIIISYAYRDLSKDIRVINLEDKK